VKNREDVRTYLASLLSAEAVDNLGIAEEVVTGRIVDPEGRGPLLAVLSAGSLRDLFTRQGMKSQFRLEVQVWTPYGKDGWTTADAEARADQLEQTVANVVQANRANTTHWISIGYAGMSQPVDMRTESGNLYLFEMIPLEVKCGS
jgi:hypothetical protein